MEETEVEEVGYSDPQRYSASVSYQLAGQADQHLHLTLSFEAESRQQAMDKLFAVIGDKTLSQVVSSAAEAGAEMELPTGVGYSSGQISLEQLEVEGRTVKIINLDTGEETQPDRIDELFLG